MAIYWEFPTAWWIAFAFVYGIYATLFLLREKRGRKELIPQLSVGLFALSLSVVFEFLFVSLKLWNYNPGNWPAILWPIYFGIGLLAYQLVKKIEEILHK